MTKNVFFNNLSLIQKGYILHTFIVLKSFIIIGSKLYILE